MPRDAAARQDAPAQRARVQTNIAPAIERWCRERQAQGRPRFHGSELEAAICAETRCTPGSPLRILREAFRHGVIEGRLVSRADSLYELGAPPSPRPQEARPATSSPPRGVVGRASVSRECPCGCHLDPGPIVRCFYGGGR